MGKATYVTFEAFVYTYGSVSPLSSLPHQSRSPFCATYTTVSSFSKPPSKWVGQIKPLFPSVLCSLAYASEHAINRQGENLTRIVEPGINFGGKSQLYDISLSICYCFLCFPIKLYNFFQKLYPIL